MEFTTVDENEKREMVVAALGGKKIPKVGDGCTEMCWSDQHAYTVIEVVSTRCVYVQRDKATRTDKNGMSDQQDYRYERDPSGKVELLVFKVTKHNPNGRWVRKSEGVRGNQFVMGVRHEHFDFSF